MYLLPVHIITLAQSTGRSLGGARAEAGLDSTYRYLYAEKTTERGARRGESPTRAPEQAGSIR